MTKTKSHINQNVKTAGYFAAAIFLLGIAVIGGLYVEQNTRVTDVRFTGNHFTEEQDLLNAFDSPVGLMADSLDLQSMISAIEVLPYVEQVSVSMARRGTLSMKIQEREPIGLLINNGKKMYLDRDGIKMPDKLGKSVDLPLVYGFNLESEKDTLNGRHFEQVRDFLVETKKDPFAWATISEVAWNEREGVVALSSENGVKLVFGHENFGRKLTHWQAFNAEVVSKKGIDAFRTIDLRFRDQIVATEL